MSGCTAEQEVRHADWELGRKGGLSEESFGSDSVTFMVWRMMSAKGIKMTASYLSIAWERGKQQGEPGWRILPIICYVSPACCILQHVVFTGVVYLF